MPGETSVNKIPYPKDADAPDGPTQIKALAELLDTLKWGSRNLKPTAGIIAGNEDLTLTTSYQDVPGAKLEYTPPVAVNLHILTVFDFLAESTTPEHEPGGEPGEAFGSVKLDSAAEQTPLAKFDIDGLGRATVSQVHSLALTAAAHTIKLRAKKGGGNAVCGGTSTRAFYIVTAQ